MPLFDYSCTACKHQFEALIRGSTVVACPECKSANVERQLSLPSVKAGAVSERALKAAKKRDAGQAKEREYTQRQYELHHDD